MVGHIGFKKNSKNILERDQLVTSLCKYDRVCFLEVNPEWRQCKPTVCRAVV